MTWLSDRSGIASIGVDSRAQYPHPATRMKPAMTRNRLRIETPISQLIIATYLRTPPEPPDDDPDEHDKAREQPQTQQPGDPHHHHHSHSTALHHHGESPSSGVLTDAPIRSCARRPACRQAPARWLSYGVMRELQRTTGGRERTWAVTQKQTRHSAGTTRHHSVLERR